MNMFSDRLQQQEPITKQNGMEQMVLGFSLTAIQRKKINIITSKVIQKLNTCLIDNNESALITTDLEIVTWVAVVILWRADKRSWASFNWDACLPNDNALFDFTPKLKLEILP